MHFFHELTIFWSAQKWCEDTFFPFSVTFPCKSAWKWQLWPFATSCVKDYKGHSVVQTSFIELPNKHENKWIAESLYWKHRIIKYKHWWVLLLESICHDYRNVSEHTLMDQHVFFWSSSLLAEVCEQNLHALQEIGHTLLQSLLGAILLQTQGQT